jgi:hypothetical protein
MLNLRAYVRPRSSRPSDIPLYLENAIIVCQEQNFTGRLELQTGVGCREQIAARLS